MVDLEQSSVTSIGTVGLVVNPRSGTDVRRAVAAAGAVTVEDKVNVVRRVVLGAREAGINRFVVHPDTHRIVQRATEPMRGLDLNWLDHELTFTEEDTVTAVAAMRDLGCGVVVVLGGDGTNRAAARGWPDLVVVPLSTGTNNAFPLLAEATVAGAAAGHVARGVGRGAFKEDSVMHRALVVRVRPDGASEPDDLWALYRCVSRGRSLSGLVPSCSIRSICGWLCSPGPSRRLSASPGWVAWWNRSPRTRTPAYFSGSGRSTHANRWYGVRLPPGTSRPGPD
ncbi:MAG: hypothetical protein Ct9H300mP12_16780 [Acidimicrobiales bacterium]|nr:MAG: hypothetical protein Ct9H300mP12_16780 [Acidimicrobiales bacterium]